MKDLSIQRAIAYGLGYAVLIQLVGFWTIFLPYEALIALGSFTTLIQAILQLLLVGFFINSFNEWGKIEYRVNADFKWLILAVVLSFVHPLATGSYSLLVGGGMEVSFGFSHFESLFSFYSLAIIFIIPIAEELLFRGILLRKLLVNHSPFVSILTSTLLFSALHFPIESFFLVFDESFFLQMYVTLFIGAGAGVLFYKTRSLSYPVIFHVLWNLLVTCAYG